MALDTERAFYPIDGNGKVTIQEILDEASGGGGNKEITIADVEGLQSALDTITSRLDSLEGE